MFGDCVLTPTADKRSQALSSLYILYGIRCGIYHGIRNICVNCTLVDSKYLACKYHFVNEIQNDSLIGCFFFSMIILICLSIRNEKEIYS